VASVESGWASCLFDLKWPLRPCWECTWAFTFYVHHRASLFITIPDVWADIIVPFQHKLVWTVAAAVTVHISPSLGLAVYPYTCIIISRKQWKCETAGERTPFKATKRGTEWKVPGRWHSRLVSIKENNKQSPFWRQLGPMCLFILRQICMFEGMHAAKDVSMRKTWREHSGNKHVPHIEMHLSWACTQGPPHLSFYLFMLLCLSPSLIHSGSTV